MTVYGRDSNGNMVKRWGSSSRTGKRVDNTLGVIWGQDVAKTKRFRREALDLYDRYYECSQYKELMPWDEAAAKSCEGSEYIGVRKRQPRINLPTAKTIMSRITAKLWGEKVFPQILVEEDPDTTAFFQAIIEWSNLKAFIAEPTRRMLNTGSEFIRFHLVNGMAKLDRYCSKYCYPVFDDAGGLESVTIKYVWTDYDDVDTNGKPKEKWYRLDLGQMSDVLYDTPEYHPSAEPAFEVVEQVDHEFGFVQGVWARTDENKHDPDGPPMVKDLMDMIDELNYSLSQSSHAIAYNQEPLLTLSGMDTEEIDNVVKSSSKALNLGRDGKAAYLETSMNGVQTAMDARDKLKMHMQEAARVLLLDPEKIVGSAQSGKAMEVLHGPMVDLVDELRPVVEKPIKELLVKLALAVLITRDRGEEVGVMMPDGWVPSTLEIKFNWPEVFPMTLEDLQKKVSLGVSAASASVVSRETVTRWLAKDFDIEDVEAEIAKIAGQPVLNTWGGF
jgi:hypothetical protein